MYSYICIILEVCENSPSLRVHLSAGGRSIFEINFQEGAPVTSVTYDTKFSRVYPEPVDSICILYNTSLRVCSIGLNIVYTLNTLQITRSNAGHVRLMYYMRNDAYIYAILIKAPNNKCKSIY